jgi:2-succinyl-5-enolpyruvyl-6-hydroxy-3-cyclohexene-1-carboxylate synthase
VVLHLGGRLVSKRLMTFIKAAQFDEYIHVADHPYRYDWQHLVSNRVEADLAQFCRSMAPLLTSPIESSLVKRLRTVSDNVGEVVRRDLDAAGSLTELGVARIVAAVTPPGSALFLANSLPIRLFDSFAGFKRKPAGETPLIACNRGASGIDGTIATATGYAAGSKRSTTLVIGDLAFLHDLNSLNIVRSLPCPLTIVLINNDGGGLFSLLPVADRQDVFETYFATPHGLSFAEAAGQFELDYRAPKTPAEFSACYHEAVQSDQAALIEVSTDRRGTRELYQRLLTAAGRAVTDL